MYHTVLKSGVCVRAHLRMNPAGGHHLQLPVMFANGKIVRCAKVASWNRASLRAGITARRSLCHACIGGIPFYTVFSVPCFDFDRSDSLQIDIIFNDAYMNGSDERRVHTLNRCFRLCRYSSQWPSSMRLRACKSPTR